MSFFTLKAAKFAFVYIFVAARSSCPSRCAVTLPVSSSLRVSGGKKIKKKGALNSKPATGGGVDALFRTSLSVGPPICQNEAISHPVRAELERAGMSTTRRFCCDDLLKFNNINLDVLTETASLQYSSSTALCVRRFTGSSSIDTAVLAIVSVSRQCKIRPLPRLPCCLLASASLYWPIIDLRNSGRIIALSHLLPNLQQIPASYPVRPYVD